MAPNDVSSLDGVDQEALSIFRRASISSHQRLWFALIANAFEYLNSETELSIVSTFFKIFSRDLVLHDYRQYCGRSDPIARTAKPSDRSPMR